MENEYNFQRFVKAQDSSFEGYAAALDEMKKGRKRGHWIWFVFPQMKGLGFSVTARTYALSSIDEAKAYLNHPVLGQRLREITSALLKHKGRRADYLMGGELDAISLMSCMTLFDIVSPNDIFAQVLDTFYAGKRCADTLDMLNVTPQ